MKDSNMKLITLEMLKNAITGVKYDKALGTQQQQLQAKTAYDNLIVQYSALVVENWIHRKRLKILLMHTSVS